MGGAASSGSILPLPEFRQILVLLNLAIPLNPNAGTVALAMHLDKA
jgi:hypothetical protein